MNILFVDLGNVCRSPMAEGLLKKKFDDHEISGNVDSAGFESFNINEPPEKRAINIGLKYGYTVGGLARIFLKKDFDRFDKIFVMDSKNYRDVMDLAKTDTQRAKVDYLLNVLEPGSNKNVPDPHNSVVDNCETIFHLLDKATDKIIASIKAEK